MESINIKLLNEHAIIPTYGSTYSAGADLYACLDEKVTINPGETKFIGTKIAVELPKFTVGLIYARSGLACKKGLAPANKVGVIDCDYRGELIVALHNHSNEKKEIEIIIVDDCSTDRTLDIIKYYQQKDERTFYRYAGQTRFSDGDVPSC